MKQVTPPTILTGITEPFEGNGRKLGYPTANIKVSSSLEEGVYFGFADLADYKHHPALIFVGTPVTVGAKTHRVEAHLLDIADKDYYNKPLRLAVHYFHRPNQHFDSIEALLAAMKKDESTARKWFIS